MPAQLAMQFLVRLSRAYTRLSSPVAFLARRFVRQAARLSPRESGVCIDIGAGTAPYRRDVIAAFRVARYVAVDIAPAIPDAVVADARLLPFRSSAVELVVSFDAIQHIAEPERVLAEVARILRPGGLVVLTFPFMYAECDFLDYQRWTIAGMEDLMVRCGLVPILSSRRGGFLFAAVCGANWALQHVVPGQRRSWRQTRTWGGVARSAVVALLTLPTNLLGWLALLFDAVAGGKGAYMGGAILAQRRQETPAPAAKDAAARSGS
jgi:ubiquinone/menaquinone biosynthesis C-methylase UbiE